MNPEVHISIYYDCGDDNRSDVIYFAPPHINCFLNYVRTHCTSCDYCEACNIYPTCIDCRGGRGLKGSNQCGHKVDTCNPLHHEDTDYMCKILECIECHSKYICTENICHEHREKKYKYAPSVGRYRHGRTEQDDKINMNIHRLFNKNKLLLLEYITRNFNKFLPGFNSFIYNILRIYHQDIDVRTIICNLSITKNVKGIQTTVYPILEAFIREYAIKDIKVPRYMLWKIYLYQNDQYYIIVDDSDHDMLWLLGSSKLNKNKLPRDVQKYEQRYNLDFMNIALKQTCTMTPDEHTCSDVVILTIT